MDFETIDFCARNILWCHWDEVKALREKDLDMYNTVLGLCDYSIMESTGERVLVDLRIFLYEGDRFILRVYTSDKEYDTLKFDSLDAALLAFECLLYTHSKYRKRPSIMRREGTNEKIGG